MRQFVRTLNGVYGFVVVSLFPFESIHQLQLFYTGPMMLPHFAGAPEQNTGCYCKIQILS